MTHGGRPRREDEQPDSQFGEALKEHLRRIKDFTQTELHRESGIPEKTLSHMVKGRRINGPAFRRDLRDIIKVLHKKQAILTLEEANLLITTIPAVSALDNRDPEDMEIIRLFDTPVTEGEQAADQNNDEAASLNVHATTDSHDDAYTSDTTPESTMKPLQIIPSPVSETSGRPEREAKNRLRRYVGSVLVVLVIVLAMVLLVTQSVFSRKTDTCPANMNGVTLYTDINNQSQCYTFGPGDYELARFGLEQNVSSIKDPNDAYHITLFDKAKNFFQIDKGMPIWHIHRKH